MTAARLAWSLWGVGMLLIPGVIFEVWFSGTGPGEIPFAIGFIAVQLGSVTAGAVVSSRLPGNAVGWIFLAIGLLMGLLFAVGSYATLGVNTGYGPLPGDGLAAWIGSWIFVPAAFGLPMFLLLLFPDGRFLSGRWKVVGWALGVLVVVAAATKAFRPGRISHNIENPLAPGGALGEALLVLDPITDVLALPGFALAVAGLAVRLKRSRGVERQQLKWFTYSAALIGAGLATSILLPEGVIADLAFLVGLSALAGLPIAAGLAILRYRLYDIDVVINRTLVYGPLTIFLALLYACAVVASQLVFRALTGGGSQLAVVASTLAIAALFNPLRRRIQDTVDRRFYRQKYDAARASRTFAAKLRDETDLAALNGELLAVVRETMRPEHASLWLRRPEEKSR